MNIIKIKTINNWKVWKDLKNFSIWDIIKTTTWWVLFNYNESLKINLLKNSWFKFSDFSFWKLIKWQAEISTLSDYTLIIWKLKINLKNSWVIVQIVNSNETWEENWEKWWTINILSTYWINKISYNSENFLLLKWYKISINENLLVKDGLKNKESSIWKNLFSQVEEMNLWQEEIKDVEKIFPEDKKNIFNIKSWDLSMFNWMLLFDWKKNKNSDFEKKQIFNKCADSMYELTLKEKEWIKKKTRFYKKFSDNCIKKEILNNKKFLEKFNKNFENISFLKEKFLIDKEKKEFLKEKFTFLEKIFYLQQSISSSDIKNFDFFLNEAKKTLEDKISVNNLEMWFILMDWILKNNLQFSFNKLFDFRWRIWDKILKNFYKAEKSKKLNFYTKKIISFNSKLIDNLLENKNFKELDYIFSHKSIFKNPNWNEDLALILVQYDKNFEEYRKILNSSKNILHWSADKTQKIEEIKKAELEKQKKEKEIKKLLDVFKIKKQEEVKITSNEQKQEIINILKEYNLKIKLWNIKAFMKWWNMFYLNNIEFLDKKYNLEFDLSNEVVSKIEWEKFDWEWSMTLKEFKNLISTNNFKQSTFDDRPSNVFQWIEEKNFSHEDFLKKELVRKYMESNWVICMAWDIKKISDNIYNVSNAKIDEYTDLNIWFNIKLIDWTISKISFYEKLKDFNFSKRVDNIKLAKNLKIKIKEIYWDYLKREENLVQVLVNLAWLWTWLKDVSLWKQDVDWFKYYKNFKMSSWDAILSWSYYVWNDTFTKANFILRDHSEDFENIKSKDLIEKIKFINSNIETLEKNKTEEELKKLKEEQRLEKIRKLNYWNDIPDELLDWDWITD